jgi:uncharacterized protein YxeA
MKKGLITASVALLVSVGSTSAIAGVYQDREQIYDRNVTFFNFTKKTDKVSYHTEEEKDTRYMEAEAFDSKTPEIELQVGDSDSISINVGYEIKRKTIEMTE